MRIITRILLLSVSLGATLASAQNPIPFQHIVIVFQENRTPDNLFGSTPSVARCGVEDPFEPGVDIENGGPNNKAGQPNPTCLVSKPLADQCNPDHTHASFTTQYDSGARDGACNNPAFNCSGACPQYAFVPKPDVQPYFDIATNYGFANYMFSDKSGA